MSRTISIRPRPRPSAASPTTWPGTNKASGLTRTRSRPSRSPPKARCSTPAAPSCPMPARATTATSSPTTSACRVTGDTLFGAIRKLVYFRTDINAMLDRMIFCLRDQAAATGFSLRDQRHCRASTSVGRIPDLLRRQPEPARLLRSLQGNDFRRQAELGNLHGQWRRELRRRPAFARTARAARSSASRPRRKTTSANYLEATQLSATSGTSFAGPILFDRSPPQSPEQDIVRCIPSGATYTDRHVARTDGPRLRPARRLRRRHTHPDFGPRRTSPPVTGLAPAPCSAALGWPNPGAAWWLSHLFPLPVQECRDNVGSNGFVFTMADALKNSLLVLRRRR